jgi:hypothetical protein
MIEICSLTERTIELKQILEKPTEYPDFYTRRGNPPCCRVRVSAWKPAGLEWLRRFSDADRAGKLQFGRYFGGVE